MKGDICRIAVLGDSVSTGTGVHAHESWPELWSQKAQKSRIDNLSGAGNTSLEALQAWQASHKNYTDVIIFIGANDALRGMPPRFLEENISQIINMARETKIRWTIVMPDIPRNYPKQFRDSYKSTYQNLATKYQASLLTLDYSDAKNKSMIGPDGLHPNKLGHMQLFETIQGHLDYCE